MYTSHFLTVASAAVLAGIIPTSARAGDASRFTPSPITNEFKPATPPGSSRTTVVLKLADEPVATVRSRAPNKRIPAAERQDIVSTLRSRQDALRLSIEANGGTVLANFQHAINGIKVDAPADRLAALAVLPGVVDVKPVAVHKLDNVRSVPFIGAPSVWSDSGFRGAGVKVAIIDTGIDYTHANFGGPGTPQAYNDAFHHSRGKAPSALFGPAAPKIKGGIDLVGDDYDASAEKKDGKPDVARRKPHPDRDPLDCNGHGSHVAGTAAGFGVTSSGRTYTGPYDSSAYGPTGEFANGADLRNLRRIGPGVAPLADLYAVRVFGCSGSTDVVVEALDWAVENDMDVVNMSLGSPFGTADTADAEATNNAVAAGIVVVASAGNSGPSAYITGTPASAEKALSVAAVDSTSQFPGATLALSTTKTVTAQNSNGATFADGTRYQVVVLYVPDKPHTAANISLGCDPNEYTAANVVGKLVVVQRGVCARVARAVFGQKAGAAAVLMVNSSDAFPPYEGPITGNPDTGEQFNVTIPFFGTRSTTGPTFVEADSGSAMATNTVVQNPAFRRFASFSSGGPRFGDGHLKPDISAPGSGIFSTAVGTGSGGKFLSGTSMAAPHVTGVAALTVESHPGWNAEEIRAAIANTADASQISQYRTRVGGGGLVQPFHATRTGVIATSGNGGTNVSFGVQEFSADFSSAAVVVVRNRGDKAANFTVGTLKTGGTSGHTVQASPSSLALGPGEVRNVQVSLQVPAANAGSSSAFRDVAGLVTLIPATESDNGGATLAVPYYLVSRARSEITAAVEGGLSRSHSSTMQLRNDSGAVTGSADFYALGLIGGNEAAGSAGIRGLGVRAWDFPLTATTSTRALVFAINTFAPTSNLSVNEYDILVDSNADGTPDYIVFGADFGAVTAGSPDGRMAAGVFNLATGTIVINFLAAAPTDGTTVELQIFARDIGVNADNPRFSYQAQAFDGFTGNADVLTGKASFNAFRSSISQGDFVTVGPGGRNTVPVTIDADESTRTPALGQMVVFIENFSGTRQASLITFSRD